jgi:hypothetical protein
VNRSAPRRANHRTHDVQGRLFSGTFKDYSLLPAEIHLRITKQGSRSSTSFDL